MNTSAKIPGLLHFCSLLVATSAFAQGVLTPPGPPAPTMKTLVEVEPRTNLQATPASAGVVTIDANYHFIINQPGSYYLSANLSVTKANGIQINAEGVTLDLNGFQISRSSGSGGNGIEILSTSHRASVRDGSIKGFANGVNSILPFESAKACAFRDLAVSGCTNRGIFAGEGAVLESCRAHDNSGSDGILTDAGSTLSNCSAYNNTTTYGIHAGAGSTLSNCSAFSNTNAAAVSAGIRTGSGCTISQSSANFNSSTAATSTPTTGMGFDVGFSSTIQNCTAFFNEGDGINLTNDTLARENACDGNGNGGNGAGLHATSAGNRIEANNVTNNDRGIDVQGSGSLIIRNSASGNTTNYVIAADNSYGTILDDSGGGAPAVSGSNATSSFGSPNAWANFAY